MLEKNKGGEWTHKKHSSETRKSGNEPTKTATLSKAGIDIKRANEAEKLAAIPEEVFESNYVTKIYNQDKYMVL